MKTGIAATALALILVAAPLAGAHACIISGGSDADCIARCYKIKNFWEQTLCSIGSAPAPAPDDGKTSR